MVSKFEQEIDDQTRRILWPAYIEDRFMIVALGVRAGTLQPLWELLKTFRSNIQGILQ